MMCFSYRIFFAVAMIAAAAAVSPTDLAAKCRSSDGVTVLPGFVLIVDGKEVSHHDTTVEDELPGLPPEDAVYSVAVTCRALSASTRQTAIVVVTKGAVRPLTRAYLQELVTAQREYRAVHGAYAGSVFDLPLRTMAPGAVELEANEHGWSASVRLNPIATACHVAVGSAEPRRLDQPRGVPVCFAVD